MNKERAAYLLIALLGIGLGYWFAQQQVLAVSLEALMTYPAGLFWLTVFKCVATILAIFFLSRAYLHFFSQGKLSTGAAAITFLPLIGVYAPIPLYAIVGLVLFMQISALLLVWCKKDYQWLCARYLIDTLVLFFFFFCHFFLTSRFSPLHWNMSLLAGDGIYTEEIPVVAPIFRGYVLAKQFAFSSFDPAEWGGIMNPPITLNSPFMQLLTLIFDFPSVSYQAFHVMLMIVHFTLFVLGSFGFYLFLKYALKIRSLFAILGGYLFFFSGPMVGRMFYEDAGVFLSSYAIFPYALLLIALAFSKNNMRYALAASLALASQFFFFTPHPEGAIYSVLFYGIFCGGLLFSYPTLPVKRKLFLIVLSLLAFFLLSAYTLIPILYDRFMGNMYVFAHTGDIAAASLKGLFIYFFLLLICLPISFYLMVKQGKCSPVYLSMVLLSLCLLFMLFVCMQPALMTRLMRLLHVGLHFWYYWRIGMYFCLTVFVFFVMTLQEMTFLSLSLIREKAPQLFGMKKA